jgi:hypothetical protein
MRICRALSAEAFLEQGYHVLMLHRLGSVLPFVRNVQSAVRGNMGCIDGEALAARLRAALVIEASDDAFSDTTSSSSPQQEKKKRLLLCPFETLEEYLTLLHAFVGAMPALLPSICRPMVYFCAAVSDFYVPQSQMATHKIQSSEHAELTLTLTRTPKMLGVLRTLAPGAVFVSFKLETDRDILLQKASAAMDAYGINVVVANELKTRREYVTLVRMCVDVYVCISSPLFQPFNAQVGDPEGEHATAQITPTEDQSIETRLVSILTDLIHTHPSV